MSRIAVAISCEAEVMNELIRMSKGRSEEARMVERSRIILGCLAGKRNDMVAAELGVRLGTVGTWRKRFAEVGLAGLSDRPRPGKPPTYPADLKQRILQRLEKSAPPGWRAGMAASWRRLWASPTTQSGAYCARKAFNCDDTAGGALAPIRSLPPRRPNH